MTYEHFLLNVFHCSGSARFFAGPCLLLALSGNKRRLALNSLTQRELDPPSSNQALLRALCDVSRGVNARSCPGRLPRPWLRARQPRLRASADQRNRREIVDDVSCERKEGRDRGRQGVPTATGWLLSRLTFIRMRYRWWGFPQYACLFLLLSWRLGGKEKLAECPYMVNLDSVDLRSNVQCFSFTFSAADEKNGQCVAGREEAEKGNTAEVVEKRVHAGVELWLFIGSPRNYVARCGW